MTTRRKNNENSENSSVNISPLIDVVFIMLIFFIVATVFVNEVGLDVSSRGGHGAKDVSPIVFHITNSGEVFSEGKAIGFAGVRVVTRNKMQTKLLPVIIEVETEAPSGAMVRVMDEVKSIKSNAFISVSRSQR